MHSRRIVFILLVSTPTLLGQAPLDLLFPRSELEPAERAAPSTALSELSERLTAARARITEVSAALVAARATPASNRVASLEQELELLGRQESLLVQQRTALERCAVLEAERRELEQQLQAARSGELQEPPPYSLSMLDRRRVALWHAEEMVAAQTDALRAAEVALARATAEARRPTTSDGEPQTPAAASDVKTASDGALDSRLSSLRGGLATETVRLRRLERACEEEWRSVGQLRRDLLAQQVELLVAQVRLEPAEIEQALTELERATAAVEQDVEVAVRAVTEAERRVREVERRHEVAGETELTTDELLTTRAVLAIRQEMRAVLGERLAHAGAERELWRWRLGLWQDRPSVEVLKEWHASANQLAGELERRARRYTARAAELRTEQLDWQSRFEGASRLHAAPPRRSGEHLRLLDEAVVFYQRELAMLDAERQLTRQLLADLALTMEHLPIDERLGQIWRAVIAVWHYEVFSAEGSPILISTIVAAVLLVLIGFSLSRRLSRWVGTRVLPRLGLERGASAALQTLLFYLALVVFSLAALHMLNVPLTIFTVMGGALAIGVGFGSQNIVNNFISGLILLIERPIKVGDLIEVDGNTGRVEAIGPRSTRVRTFANIHLLVPNSTFLESNVINWTLADSLVRLKISVGVAYGSPTREVERLIHQAMAENTGIAKTPAPEVFFVEFGDNTLQFDAFFWLQIGPQNDMRRVQSELRFRIDELFCEYGIVIAFPQRDLHLDTTKPLEVRVMPP